MEDAKKEISFKVSKMNIGNSVFFYNGNELIETTIIGLYDTGEYVKMYNVEFVRGNNNFFCKLYISLQ